MPCTVIVAFTAVEPLLVAVKLDILPVPFAAKPINVLLFVYVIEAPERLDVKFIPVVGCPLHKICEIGVREIKGIGLTVIVPVALTVPQPPVNGML